MNSSRSANFDPLAGIYDRLARCAFGDTLDLAQQQGLQDLPDHGEIAIFGGGSGRLLETLVTSETRCSQIFYIDASAKMVALARARIGAKNVESSNTAVQFFVQRAEDWCRQRSRPVDAVITPFFLDCFDGTQLKQMIAQIAALLRAGGQWLATDFAASPKLRHRLVMAGMFKFFQFSCGLQSSQLEPYFDLIEEQGLRSLEQQQFASVAGTVRSQRFERPANFDVDTPDSNR